MVSISDNQLGFVLCEVVIDKFGNVERRDHWQVLKAAPHDAFPITRKAYLAAIKRGVPHKVNAYEPSDNHNEYAESEEV